MTHPDAAPQLNLPSVDPAMQEFANNRIAELNGNPELLAQTPDATRVALAGVSLAPTVEAAGGYTAQDGPNYTTHDIDASLARQPRHARAAEAPVDAEVGDAVAPAGSLADRVRLARQAGGLRGHQGGQGIGQRIMAAHPVDMSDAAVARRQAAHRVWESHHQS